MSLLRRFSDDDLDLIQMAIDEARGKRVNLDEERTLYSRPNPAPEVYVAKVPTGGIPPLSPVGTSGDFLCGFVTCDLYRIDDADQLQDLGIERTIYNVSGATINTQFVPVKRTKGGPWICDVLSEKSFISIAISTLGNPINSSFERQNVGSLFSWDSANDKVTIARDANIQMSMTLPVTLTHNGSTTVIAPGAYFGGTFELVSDSGLSDPPDITLMPYGSYVPWGNPAVVVYPQIKLTVAFHSPGGDVEAGDQCWPALVAWAAAFGYTAANSGTGYFNVQEL